MAQDYRARLLIPEAGDPAMKLFTRNGTLIADGYVRVVIGERGPDGGIGDRYGKQCGFYSLRSNRHCGL